MVKKRYLFFICTPLVLLIIFYIIFQTISLDRVIENITYRLGRQLRIIDGSQYIEQYGEVSSNVMAIKMVYKFIDSYEIEEISDFVIINSPSQIPFQEEDKKDPELYDIYRIYDETGDEGVIYVYFITWTEKGGILAQWKVTVLKNEIMYLYAKIIDVGVGHYTSINEGFVPAPGITLVNKQL